MHQSQPRLATKTKASPMEEKASVDPPQNFFTKTSRGVPVSLIFVRIAEITRSFSSSFEPFLLANH